MIRLVTAAALLIASMSVQASEAACLSAIMYSEARGASIEGVMTLGECTVTRAKKQKRDICNVQGVTSRSPAPAVRGYYIALAKHLLRNPSTKLSGECDSWNAGKKPAMPGKITRHIDGQVFFALK